jgi:hypothetical protein
MQSKFGSEIRRITSFGAIMVMLASSATVIGTSVAAGAATDVVICPTSTVSVVSSSAAHTTVLYRTFFDGPSTGSSATEQSNTTTSYTVSTSVSGTANLIFGNIQATVSGSIAWNVAAAFGSNYVTQPIPAGQTQYVAYISRYYHVTGVIQDNLANCTTKTVGSWSANAPTIDGWTQSFSIINNT